MSLPSSVSVVELDPRHLASGSEAFAVMSIVAGAMNVAPLGAGLVNTTVGAPFSSATVTASVADVAPAPSSS